ncbi:MAG: hypothetical protein ACT4R6_05035 [Gemmatimonadaceae bacterium]
MLAVLSLGIVGTGVELLLLEHTEDVWQWVPLGLFAVALVVIAWHIVRASRSSVRALQAVMLLFVVSGLVGLWLHYRGNVEFEREMYPSLAGWQLFKQAMMGATPSLAPGTMVQLGLIGLLYAFRHPAKRRGALDASIPTVGDSHDT